MWACRSSMTCSSANRFLEIKRKYLPCAWHWQQGLLTYSCLYRRRRIHRVDVLLLIDWFRIIGKLSIRISASRRVLPVPLPLPMLWFLLIQIVHLYKWDLCSSGQRRSTNLFDLFDVNRCMPTATVCHFLNSRLIWGQTAFKSGKCSTSLRI